MMYLTDELVRSLERKFEIKVMSQCELREFLDENIAEYGKEFPMICYEHTDDSNIEVGFDESKFLNDKAHEGTWIVGFNYSEAIFIMCLKDDENELCIDALEVANSERLNKIAEYVLDDVEYVASKYFDGVYISPFDTSAMNFWEHMGYKEDYGGYYTKKFI